MAQNLYRCHKDPDADHYLKKPAAKVAPKKAGKQQASKKDADTYDELKFFDGHQYTGMPVGRSHKWYYDKGDWRETKITPDLWEISYAVTKRRAGKAPEGSGVPTGTAYQWYIFAYQNVCKLNEDDYTTNLKGLKFKLAHKRADKNKWSASSPAQRKKLVKMMKEIIADLEKQPLPLEFEYRKSLVKGEVIPISQSCAGGICNEFDVFICNSHFGIIKRRKSGWKMDNATDLKFIKAIGLAIESVTK